jgi:hypothetical protein
VTDATNRTPDATRLFSDVTLAFRAFCRHMNARVFSEGADRHGAYVWEAGWVDAGDRYLTVSLQTVPEFLTEVWSAAASDRAYSRKLVYQSADAVLFKRQLSSALRSAVDAARGITPGEPDSLTLPAETSVIR